MLTVQDIMRYWLETNFKSVPICQNTFSPHWNRPGEKVFWQIGTDMLIPINNYPAGLWTTPFCMVWTPNTTVTRSLPFLAMMRLQSQPLSTDVMKFSFQTEDTRQLGKGFHCNCQLYFPTLCKWRYVQFFFKLFLFIWK